MQGSGAYNRLWWETALFFVLRARHPTATNDMAADKGSPGPGAGHVFIDSEAECSDIETTGDLDDSQSDCTDLVDNSLVDEGNHLAVFQKLERKAGENAVTQLKRKLQISPQSQDAEVEGLSPSLAAITLGPSPRNPLVKRRLFTEEAQIHHEATSNVQVPLNQTEEGGVYDSEGGRSILNETPLSGGLHIDILKAKNTKAARLALFKDAYVVSFCDLTRPYLNNKTTNAQWVVAGFAVTEPLYTASVLLLRQQCLYLQGSRRSLQKGSVSLFLLHFPVAKCRDTVKNLLLSLWSIPESHIICDPPKIRGACAAFFWLKNALVDGVSVHGEAPPWIQHQTSLTEGSSENLKFDLGKLVQYAYDNNILEESRLAYEYACLADVEANARAWLTCNNQARFIKDAVVMARHYKRAEMLKLSMSAYLSRRCSEITGAGSWRPIVSLLRYHGIEPIRLVNAFKLWLKGTPKHNCIVLIGPPSTGKSMFSNSLMGFLGGKVLSFQCHRSHFWLEPLAETKAALLDDATDPCWKYFEIYLRNALDGYPICIDRKHRAPIQIKAPPLMVTTNVDIMTMPKYIYLHSRCTPFYFTQPCPQLDNESDFRISISDWKHFFERLWRRLDLSDQEDEDDDGRGLRSLTCSARNTNGND